MEATQKTIEIEGIDPREFYGVGNRHLEQISDMFPKLKIMARGSTLKVLGEPGEVARFGKKIDELTEYYAKYGHISTEVIDRMLSGGMPEGKGERADKDVIVYGNNGNIVRARTVNQQALVRLYDTDDLLFAVGPAGSGKTYTAIAACDSGGVEEQRGEACYTHTPGCGGG